MSTAIKPTPKIYREAARIIEKEGWTTHSYVNAKGCYCMEGAILKAAKLIPGPESSIGRGCNLIDYADEFLPTKTNGRYYSAVDFNDDQQSKEPVIQMLNDIADALEKEEANA